MLKNLIQINNYVEFYIIIYKENLIFNFFVKTIDELMFIFYNANIGGG